MWSHLPLGLQTFPLVTSIHNLVHDESIIVTGHVIDPFMQGQD